MDWDKLRIFHKVANAGSLTHAGEELNLSQSAVSRHIRSLEESLNVTLFHRHARGLILTEQGELLFNATGEMTKKLEATSARIRDSEDGVAGELRVTTTTGFGTLWLTRRLGLLLEKYPKLKIDLNLNERVLDLPMRESDVAIRMKEPSQADLVRRRLMDVRMQLYATPQYLAANAAPTTTEELASHRLITQAVDSLQPSASATWSASLLSADQSSYVTINSYFGVLQATLHGLGIGVLPDYLEYEVPGLVRVLPEESSDDIPVFLAYPEELRQSKRVTAFREFVLEQIQAYRRERREDT